MRAFGVGCFHFSIKNDINQEISIGTYINEITKTLQKLTAASDVTVSFDQSFKHERIDTTPPNPKINNGDHCHPAIPFLNLAFKLYIPSRIQADLIQVPERNLNTGTENFKITMRHEWHGPVSYVECLNAKEKSRPSTAIQVVREYLKQEITKLETFLEYDFLGPSPFHANFYLNEIDTETIKRPDEPAYVLKETKTPGYNTLDFQYNPNNFQSESEALEELQETLADELSFFYELNKDSYCCLKKWMEIQETTHSILDYEENKNSKNMTKRFFEKPKLFRKAFKDIGLFKGHLIFLKGQIERNYASIYKSGKRDTYLKAYIDQELSEHSAYPLDETSELIKYFDQKSSKTIELLTILSAGILGGIVGSTITTAFGS